MLTVVGGSIVLIMEYVPGGSLEGLLELFEQLPLGAPANVLLDIGGECKPALGAGAHHRKRAVAFLVAPRDLGASGAARRRFRKAARAVLFSVRLKNSAGKNVVGTPAYMAPEACLRSARAWSDVWSLGISVCQLVAGGLPYDVSNYEPVSFVWRLGRGEIVPARIPPQVLADADAAAFVRSCLMPKAADRPTTRELMSHAFVQVDHHDDATSRSLPSVTIPSAPEHELHPSASRPAGARDTTPSSLTAGNQSSLTDGRVTPPVELRADFADRRPRTRTHFIARYGEEGGAALWAAAPPATGTREPKRVRGGTVAAAEVAAGAAARDGQAGVQEVGKSGGKRVAKGTMHVAHGTRDVGMWMWNKAQKGIHAKADHPEGDHAADLKVDHPEPSAGWLQHL
eukprot:gene48594-38099_t